MRFHPILAFIAFTGTVGAAPITITNHSFELPAIGAGTFATTSAPPGWTAYGGNINFGNRTVGVLDPATTTLYAGPVPHGQNVGVIFLMDNPNNQSQFAGIEAGMQQMLTATLQPSTRYTLTIEVGNITLAQGHSFEFLGFPNYRIDLLAGTNVIASDNNSLLPGEGQFLTSTVTVSTAVSHPLAGAPLGIRLVNLNSAAGIEVNFDNIRLDATPVPVPMVFTVLSFSNGTVVLGVSNLTQGVTNRLLRAAEPGGEWTNIFTFVSVTASTNCIDPTPLPEGAYYRMDAL